MIDLADLANRFRQSNPEAGPQQRAEFVVNTLAALNAPIKALAQDALPLSFTRSDDMPNGNNMDPRSTRPASIDRRFGGRDQDPQDDPLSRLTSRLRNGNGNDRRTSRDQTPTSMSDPGSFSQNFDQDPADMDANTLTRFVRMCIAGLQGPERDTFLQNLAQLVSAPGMDARPARDRRGARDRRQAQDSAIAVLRQKGFLSRFPDAGKIRLSSSWRD